ncbi:MULTISPECIES: hypothetical protein [unclassified Dyadobacter]|uniref:hypothetical protein n=1 Tax=unclassified Dyadobacter TaxID=2625061 RepID=UPI001F1BFB46|nr:MULTISPECIES: hypothetical protein [unclassified Dyadobacter]MCE7071682.1 hypothetical protein [Dyadobacter sp. CY327]MCF2519339.1 hypothetical protein [Dyadobacter sp. CY351]
MEHIFKRMREAGSLAEYEAASNECLDYFQTATEAEREVIGKFMVQEAEELLAQSRETRKKADAIIAEYHKSKDVNIEINGQKYPLSEWVTMKEYCRRFGLKNTMIINNWISRNIIPEENILNISQLNNLRLIKAVPYK